MSKNNEIRRVEHLPQQSRFVLYIGDALAGHADYTQVDDVRDFDHTVTEPEFRGKGVAGDVVRQALDATRAEGLKVGTSCSYVEKFVAEHPEYRN
ncbi:MAG: GNAT family N-acetyltransferase [Rhodococcus sp. (in: high G+C Gram-positive bacteria)]|uniref:GNAT family N-acetyltransferase n=1 Tax=Rhodococcus sp. TaxID=1831 RepID=UPI003BB6F4F7